MSDERSPRTVTHMSEPLYTTKDAVTVLPDGSAFAIGELPLPHDHWLYQPSTPEPPLCSSPLSLWIRDSVRWALRASIRKPEEVGFDPDALVRNVVLALCGPSNSFAKES